MCMIASFLSLWIQHDVEWSNGTICGNNLHPDLQSPTTIAFVINYKTICPTIAIQICRCHKQRERARWWPILSISSAFFDDFFLFQFDCTRTRSHTLVFLYVHFFFSLGVQKTPHKTHLSLYIYLNAYSLNHRQLGAHFFSHPYRRVWAMANLNSKSREAFLPTTVAQFDDDDARVIVMLNNANIYYDTHSRWNIQIRKAKCVYAKPKETKRKESEACDLAWEKRKGREEAHKRERRENKPDTRKNISYPINWTYITA